MNLESQEGLEQNASESVLIKEKELDKNEFSNGESGVEKGSKDGFSDRKSELLKELEKSLSCKETTEEKLSCTIDFMRDALSRFGEPDLRGFWDVRRVALPLFKESINPIVRIKLWNDFSTLSQEARKLKEIIDEEVSFAKEQLDIAVQALETDLVEYENRLAQVNEIQLPNESDFLNEKAAFYGEKQRELNLLNSFAIRINSLRKEILKVGMRLRFKSKFLKALSFCGDKVFPKRKELIKIISDSFDKDINEFVERFFNSDEFQVPFFVLKNDIKVLQNVAKILTLSTKTFTDTRLKLSSCWDKIKEFETQKRVEFSEKRKDLKDNFDSIEVKVKEFAEKCVTLSLPEALKLKEDILAEIKVKDLFKSDAVKLKQDLSLALKPLEDKEAEEKEKVRLIREEELKVKTQKIEEGISLLEQLISKENNSSLEELLKERDTILASLKELNLNKLEKQKVDRILKPLKDLIIEKKEQSLLNLSTDQLEALTQMKEVLSQRVARKNEIKGQLEKLRKELGGSGLDFEKAIAFREMIDFEKERLDKINIMIAEIEDQISKIEG